MKTIARINADGSLLLRGEVYELVASWEEAQNIDDQFEIDDETEIDDEMDFEVLIKILLGIKNKWSEVDGQYFDSKGNLFVKEMLEILENGLSLTSDEKIEITDIEEGVDLD